MKPMMMRFTATALFAVLSGSLCLQAQEQSARKEEEREHKRERPPRYRVTDLGTLPGGTFSQAEGGITDNGLIGGFSTVPSGAQHAVLWEGVITDIGTPGLGGPNSRALGVNEWGQASGKAETSTLDPNGEDFCGFGTHLICRPFLWQDGGLTALPTLGGDNGTAGRVNNRGEVAGTAENTTPDSTCPAAGPQVFQEKPVIWKEGKVHELPTFAGDPDGQSFGINDKGQVIGSSGSCSTLNPSAGYYIQSRHVLLWERDGSVHDLGNLGGTGTFGPGNFPVELNNQGQVVGVSDLKGDTTWHAFLWTKETGKMRDLRTLPGDVNSAGLGINDRGEVVGISLDASGNLHPFLWQKGVMTNLNTLVPADSPLYLLFAHSINSRGEIVGFGATSSGEIHGFLAIPRHPDHDDCDDSENADCR
jgi:probable HAF family extracellular repeat protein